VDPNRLYTEDLERNLYSTRMYTRNAIKNLIRAANGLKDVPLMWNNIPDILIKSLPLSDELRNKFHINRRLWRRENSRVEEYDVGMYIESPGGERFKQDTNTIKELQNVLITNISDDLVPDIQYESVLLNMETFQGNRIEPEFLNLNQIMDFLNFNIPQSDIILWIEQEISYNIGYKEFITTVLHIVSEWFWWRNITSAPEWPGVIFLNHMGFRHCLDKGSDNAIILGMERESLRHDGHEDLIIYMITQSHIPLYARYPLKSDNLINNDGDLINNINNDDDVLDVILTIRFRERVSVEWLNQPDLPGRSLHGVNFWPVDIIRIWR
jgi:hypothetical protein